MIGFHVQVHEAQCAALARLGLAVIPLPEQDTSQVVGRRVLDAAAVHAGGRAGGGRIRADAWGAGHGGV